MKKTNHLFPIFLGIIIYIMYFLSKNPSLPKLEANPWWGPDSDGVDDPTIRSFKIDVPHSEIDDLNNRLSIPLRMVKSLEKANFTYGIDTNVLKGIVDYWRKDYSWKLTERRLNKLPHFKTQIEGLDIHFVHVKPSLKDMPRNITVFPLLMIHGWPGSFLEFEEVVNYLTSPREGSSVVFEVIIPSIPGYGFSEAPSKQGFGFLQSSQVFLKLMTRLGFRKFCVHGGNWGGLISLTMTTLYPKSVVAMHSNSPIINTPGTNIQHIFGSFLPSKVMVSVHDEHLFFPLFEKFNDIWRETGPLHMHTTKPDTIGAILNSSPSGFAAYALEKFSSWTSKQNQFKSDGGLNNFPISLDKLLDNISLYWFTQSITTSFRFFKESFIPIFHSKIFEITSHVPVGFSAFSDDVFIQPEYTLALKYKYIVAYNKYKSGGHFAAMENPDIIAGDIHKLLTEIGRRERLLKTL